MKRVVIGALIALCGLATLIVGLVVGLRPVSASWQYTYLSYHRSGVAACGSALGARYQSLHSPQFHNVRQAGFKVIEADEQIIAACHQRRETPLIASVGLISAGAVLLVGGGLVGATRFTGGRGGPRRLGVRTKRA